MNEIRPDQVVRLRQLRRALLSLTGVLLDLAEESGCLLREIEAAMSDDENNGGGEWKS